VFRALQPVNLALKRAYVRRHLLCQGFEGCGSLLVLGCGDSFKLIQQICGKIQRLGSG